MKKTLIWAAWILGGLTLLVLVGAGVEPHHVLSRTRHFQASPERVWTAILSIRQLPIDRSDMKNIESPAEKDRLPRTIEVLGSPVKIEGPTQRPPAELVVTTSEPDLVYSGRWTFTLAPDNDGTTLKVTEDASITSRPVRFAVIRILGEDVLIDGIFKAITRKLSETPRTMGGD